MLGVFWALFCFVVLWVCFALFCFAIFVIFGILIFGFLFICGGVFFVDLVFFFSPNGTIPLLLVYQIFGPWADDGYMKKKEVTKSPVCRYSLCHSIIVK